jgi:hypothetical protein
MANDNGQADDLNSGNEELKGFNVDDVDTENPTPESVELLKKYAKTVAGQKGHWQEKYNRDAVDPATGKPFKELFAGTQQKPTSPPNAPNGTAGTDKVEKLEGTVAELKLSEEKRQFAYAKGYSPEETDYIFDFAKGRGKKAEEVVEHPFIKAGITALREEKNVSDNTPGPSGRAPKVEGKTFGEMKPEERKNNFGAVVQGLTRKKPK